MTIKDQENIEQILRTQRLKSFGLIMIIFGILFLGAGQYLQVREAQKNAHDQLTNLVHSQDDQTKKIVAQTDLIREQNDVISCLLTLQIGPNSISQSDRDECQHQAQQLRDGQLFSTLPVGNESQPQATNGTSSAASPAQKQPQQAPTPQPSTLQQLLNSLQDPLGAILGS